MLLSIVLIGFVANAVATVVSRRWRLRSDTSAGRLFPDSRFGWALRRSMPIASIALGIGSVLALLGHQTAPDHGVMAAMRGLLALLAAVAFALMATCILFNRPKFVALASRRNEPGMLGTSAQPDG